MKCGICVCGLNGSGKTTLAGALAKELNFKHMDIEQYYFISTYNPYSSSRTREEVERLLLEDIKKNPCFVFSAVNGNMTPEINENYTLVVYLDVPLDVRMKRIRQELLINSEIGYFRAEICTSKKKSFLHLQKKELLKRLRIG